MPGRSPAPLSLFALAVFAASTVEAQDALDEIVVSASRHEQRAFDAPAAVNSVGADEIRGAGPRLNISEPLRRLPGIVALERQNYAQDLQLSVRGFGARSAFGVRGLRILVDGIPATMPDGQGQVSAIDLGSAERIEVLRGPLAQLYGNAAGGVVQVTTAVGGADRIEGSIDVARDGTHRLGLRMLGERGAVRGAVSASDFRTDGWRRHSAAERQLYNAKLQFDIAPATRLTLVGNVFEQPEAEDPGGLTRADFRNAPRSVAPIAIEQDTRKTVRQHQAGLTLEHTIDSTRTLTARLYFGQRDLFQALAIPPAAQAGPKSSGGIVDLDRDYGGLGLQYTHRTGAVEYTLGFEADGLREHRRGYVNDGGRRGALKRDEGDTVWNADVYAQLSWRFAERWSALAGVRRSMVRFDVDDDFITGGNPDDSGDVKYHATSPVTGLTFHASDALNLYVNFGLGFETPSFTELAYTADDSGLNFALDPARSRHWEAGLKYRPSNKTQLDVAAFRIETRDELVVASNVGGRTVYRNADRTERHGLELLYRMRLSDTVAAHLAWTELVARFDSDDVTDGNRLPGTPDRQLYAALLWQPQWQGALEGFGAALEAVHVGRMYVDDANSDAADAHTRLNLRAEVFKDYGDWSLRSYARLDNLTGRDYAGSVIVNQSVGRYFEPAPGRSWSVGMIAEWRL